MASLRVDCLEVRYGAFQAVREASLELKPGEIVALVGPNGAGKTTLLRAVCGLVRPAGGSIRFDGHDLARLDPPDIVELGVIRVPEGRRIFRTLSVRENLDLGAFLPRARRERDNTLGTVLEIFPILRERARQLAGTLSGGEQQMLALGRALMSQPALLLLDEPSHGLAPRLVDQLFELLEAIRARGVGILLVEQDARRALEIATRGYVLDWGRIVKADTAEHLLRDPELEEAYFGVGGAGRSEESSR